MDGYLQAELGTKGFLGIYKEAYKVTQSQKRILSNLYLALILPLSTLILSQMQINNIIVDRLISRSNGEEANPDWIAFGVVNGIYLFLLLALSLFSISAIVYTVACTYSCQEITYKKVIVVITKVWKRLIVTFLCCFFVVLVYSGVAFGSLVGFYSSVNGFEGQGSRKTLIFIICMSIPYVIGLIHINIVWHLSTVISVLEKDYGIKAMIKSMKLMKGKLWISAAVFTMLEITIIGILVVFGVLVGYGDNILNMAGKVCLGILCYLVLPILIYFSLVVQTITYFVFKAYHGEEIDKSDLAQRLQVSYVQMVKENEVESQRVPV